MRKKILDAAILCVFCSSLILSSNIHRNYAIAVAEEQKVVYSGKSFTTESNELDSKEEQADIEPNEVARVASPYYSNNENEEVETVEPVTNEINTYTNRWNIYLTSEEIDLLAKIVWVEACGEPVEGQEAVVEVIFNRMSMDMYPDTLYGVLSQKDPVQFCSWELRDTAMPTDKEYQSIYNVLYGNTHILRDDTIYFSTFNLTSNIDVKICCHYFCAP